MLSQIKKRWPHGYWASLFPDRAGRVRALTGDLCCVLEKTISRDILHSVFYLFSYKPHDVITFLTCIIQKRHLQNEKNIPNRKTPFFFILKNISNKQQYFPFIGNLISRDFLRFCFSVFSLVSSDWEDVSNSRRFWKLTHLEVRQKYSATRFILNHNFLCSGLKCFQNACFLLDNFLQHPRYKKLLVVMHFVVSSIN